MPPAASTSNPSRFLAPFGPLPASRSFNIQSDTLSYSFWTSACFPAASTSNPTRFLAPFGPLPASPQLQRPIHHGFLLLLDFCHASRSFNVQSTTISCSFWTSAMPPAASTSNPSRFLAPFGLPHASRSFNVQSVTLSCSFWTSAMPPAASTSNPPRFLAPFGLLPAFPQLQRPIHTCLPTTTSSSQRKKATPAHQCQHCFISFNSIIQSNYNSIIFQLSLKNQ